MLLLLYITKICKINILIFDIIKFNKYIKNFKNIKIDQDIKKDIIKNDNKNYDINNDDINIRFEAALNNFLEKLAKI